MLKLLFAFLVVFTLQGCAMFDRADDAAAAKQKMVGMSKEDVLACMGPPGRKAAEGTTEVWSYRSTDDSHTSNGISTPVGSTWLNTSEGQKYFCIVNIVMTNNMVKVVHYTGPRSGTMASDEQCGFAVEHCAHND